MVAGKPAMPEFEEVKAHKLWRQQNRSWCRHRVMGKADDALHNQSDSVRLYPALSLDYTYVTQSENVNLVVAGHDDHIGCIMAWIVIGQCGRKSVHVDERDVSQHCFLER